MSLIDREITEIYKLLRVIADRIVALEDKNAKKDDYAKIEELPDILAKYEKITREACGGATINLESVHFSRYLHLYKKAYGLEATLDMCDDLPKQVSTQGNKRTAIEGCARFLFEYGR